MRFLRILVLAGGGSTLAIGLYAQEFSAGWGGMQTPDLNQTSWTFQYTYRQDFTRNFAASFTWLNEGHVTGHHRDGTVWQLWGTLPLADDHFALSFGVGPYYYYDTERTPDGSIDVHGTAPVYSLAATWYSDRRWFARLTLNRVNPQNDIKINTADFGFGVWLGRGERPTKGDFGDPPGARPYTGNEFTVFGGVSVENSFNGEHRYASSVEYRLGVLPHLDWTVSYIRETNLQVARRSGLATQIWPVNTFLNDRLSMGAGVGLYAAVGPHNRFRPDNTPAPVVSPLLSTEISYRFAKHWFVRFIFHRIVSYVSPDSDVALVGIGYRVK